MAKARRPARASTSLRRVLIRDLIVGARVGVYRHEREAQQRVRINLDLGVREADPKTVRDRLAQVVDYEQVVNLVRRVVGDGHLNLVETLAERIAAACFRDRRVRDAKVRVEKLDVFPDTSAVGIEIERRSPYR